MLWLLRKLQLRSISFLDLLFILFYFLLLLLYMYHRYTCTYEQLWLKLSEIDNYKYYIILYNKNCKR